MAKRKVNVKGTEIFVFSKEKEDYISLTDIAKYKDLERTNYIIQNWMRSRSTIEFIGLWELLHNPDFKGIEFDAFKNEAGSNSFTLTPKRWITATNAIGIISKAGRYGGTYAHQDIAFEFASWISAEFKLYLLKEFQRLKQAEIDQKKLEWNVSRIWENCKRMARKISGFKRQYQGLCYLRAVSCSFKYGKLQFRTYQNANTIR